MPDTVTCSTCGASISASSRFCPMCGSAVADAAPEPPPASAAGTEAPAAPASADEPPSAPEMGVVRSGAEFAQEVRRWATSGHEARAVAPAPAPASAPPAAPSAAPAAGTGGEAPRHDGVTSGAQFGREVRSWGPEAPRAEAPPAPAAETIIVRADAPAPTPPADLPEAPPASASEPLAPPAPSSGPPPPAPAPVAGTAPLPVGAHAGSAAGAATPPVPPPAPGESAPPAPSSSGPAPAAAAPSGVADPVPRPSSEGVGDGPPREHTFSGAPTVDPVASARAVIPDADEAKGFLASLFDFSFRSFVFPQIVQLVYLIGVVLISIGAVVTFLAMARDGATGFIAGLVVAAVAWFLGVVFFRILMEICLVFFSIRDHVAAIDRRDD